MYIAMRVYSFCVAIVEVNLPLIPLDHIFSSDMRYFPHGFPNVHMQIPHEFSHNIQIQSLTFLTKGRRTLDPKRANDILPKSVEE